MRGRNKRGVWLMLALAAFTPARLMAQQYAPADPQVPLPYGSTRPEDGGFYTYGKVLLYRQTNPIKDQVVAVRGLFAYDTGATTVTQILQGFQPNALPLLPGRLPDSSRDTPIPNGQNLGGAALVIGGVFVVFPAFAFIGAQPVRIVGQFYIEPRIFDVKGLFNNQGFIGSQEVALDTKQLATRAPYQPGTELGFGWKFGDGSSVSLGWKYLTEVKNQAGATLAPRAQFDAPQIQPGQQLENTFLFSPVYNFPPEYAGADYKVRPINGLNLTSQSAQFQQLAPFLINVNPQTVYGIWNGATIMTLSWRQWFQQYEIAYRQPVWENESYRVNGIAGPRYAWFWEKFKWITTSIGQNPAGQILNSQGANQTGPQNVAIYSNITSNRMYGVFAGCEQEWYMGHGFAAMLRVDGALFLDSVKEKAKYETAAKYLNLPQSKRSKIEWSVAPEVNASLGLMWYPTEFVQVYGGYDLMAFFNTRASPRPIDFDYINVNPRWTSQNRWIDGWNAGVAFTF